MTDFLTDLYNYVCEHTPKIHNDPKYEQSLQAYMEIETEVKEKIGDEFLSKYQLAEAEVTHRWGVAVFAHTLRLGRSFLLEVLKA